MTNHPKTAEKVAEQAVSKPDELASTIVGLCGWHSEWRDVVAAHAKAARIIEARDAALISSDRREREKRSVEIRWMRHGEIPVNNIKLAWTNGIGVILIDSKAKRYDADISEFDGTSLLMLSRNNETLYAKNGDGPTLLQIVGDFTVVVESCSKYTTILLLLPKFEVAHLTYADLPLPEQMDTEEIPHMLAEKTMEFINKKK